MADEKFAKDLSFMTEKDWANLRKADVERWRRWEEEKRRLREQQTEEETMPC